MIRKTRQPILGVACLENDHLNADYGRFEPSDQAGIGLDEPGSFGSPASWPVTTVYAVAKGGGPVAAVSGADEAASGVANAVHKLVPETDFIIADCGLFWSGWKYLRGQTETPVMLSGLDLLDLALGMSTAPVGILTHSEPATVKMLADHPKRNRMSILGFNDLKSWKATETPDYVAKGGWSEESLKSEFLERLGPELKFGKLQDVRSIVIECTRMPKWRADIRKLTSVPIFDIKSFTQAALD